MSYKKKVIGGLVFGFFAATPMIAAQISVPNIFQSGETASAEAVNQNFSALADRITALEQEVSDLETAGADSESRIGDIEASELFARENFVVDLDEFLEVHFMSPDDTAVQGPILRVTGANLQIINAAEAQDEADGTGNLVVGFAQARSEELFDQDPICSIGGYSEEADCTAAGHTWSVDHNGGSHNVIGGIHPAYSRTGGLVMGRASAITGLQSVVSGGRSNVSRGSHNAISGGFANDSSGLDATVSGGARNTVAARQATVSGGRLCVVDVDEGWGAEHADGTIEGDC